jgi:erythromycin esterase-like protein
LVPRLEQALGTPLPTRTRRAIQNLFELATWRSSAERAEDRRLLLSLLERFGKGPGPRGYWERVLQGLLFLDEDHWQLQEKKYVPTALFSLRDQQLADHLLWLMARHPGERVIVLAHHGHIRRDAVPLICDKPEHHHGTETALAMGQVIARALGDDYVSIGISAAAGQSGLTRGEPTPVPVATERSLEFPALGLTPDRIFVDHARLKSMGPRVSQHQTTSPDLELDYSRLYDGMIIFSQMSPNQLRAGCEKL